MVARRPPRQYAAEGLRTQTLLFTFFGEHVMRPLGRTPISTKTLLTVLDRLDISADAGRSTLTRMVRRGFLERSRSGRRAGYAMTDRLQHLLDEGAQRLFTPPVRSTHTGAWTLLSFSIPESKRGERHSLRTALGWNGFGPLRDGLWIAPGDVDVTRMLDLAALEDNVDVFVGAAVTPTDIDEIVRRAWDLDRVADKYREFIGVWRSGGPTELTPLARQVRIMTEWQQILVTDPQLPAAHLPDGWPALDAFELFQRTLAGDHVAAVAEFQSILETIPAGPGDDEGGSA